MQIIQEYKERISSVEENDLRQFGFVFGTIAIVFLGWILPWLNPLIPKWRYAYIGLPFLFVAFVFPNALKPVFFVATAIGLVLGKINNFILLTLMFWILFTPYSILIRNFTKKLGARFSKSSDRDTFKIYRNERITPDQLEKLF
jgi:hypothetical protein